MKDILVLAGRKPYPLNDGWSLRTHFLVKALTELGAAVDLLAFDNNSGPPGCGELDSLCREVVIVPRAKNYSCGDLFKGLFSATPFSVLNYAEKEYDKAFSMLISKNDYGYIQVEDIVMAQYAVRAEGIKRALDMHNIESDLLRRYAENTGSALKGLYARITADKLESYETSAANRFDTVFVCSEDEKVELERKGWRTPVAVLPNGVDCSFYEDLSHDSSEEALVFVGSMDYHANISAIRFFVSEVLPQLNDRCPGLKAYVVGKNPPAEIRMMADKNLIITGSVPDVRPYLEKGRISIVPMIVGGGTRLKILEAMAAGLPVVSTSLGAEGLNITHGDNILIADSAEDFALQILRLFENPAAGEAIARKGKLFALENYDWGTVTSRLKTIVASLTGKES